MRKARTALAALLAAVAGCSRSGPSSHSGFSIDVIGRLERGSVVHVRVQREGGGEGGHPALAWTPAAGATLLGGDSLRLERAGPLAITATVAGSTVRRTVAVAAPPVIVFERAGPGGRDLFRVSLDGRDLAPLVEHPGEDRDPTVAAGRVVFVSHRDGDADLYAVPLAGGAASAITRTPRNETTPALSPDGSRLAYTADLPGVHRIWTARADGTGASRLTPGFGYAGHLETSPAWSRNGELAFAATPDGDADLFVAGPDAAVAVLAAGAGADLEPAWSPDGSRLAFVSTRTGDAEVYVLDVATGEVRRLTHRAGPDGEPAWTSDGRVVYTEYAGRSAFLRWIDPDRPSTTHLVPTPGGSASNPAVVP